MTIKELKRYIYENNSKTDYGVSKISYILGKLGCHHIKETNDKVVCCNPDGDNKNAVCVFKTENLPVVNYTRPKLKEISIYPDIITLVQFYKNQDVRQAICWLHDLFNLSLDYSPEPEEEENDILDMFESIHNNSEREETEYETLDDDLLLDYAPYPYYDFALDSLLCDSTINKFKIGYSYKARRTIIPVTRWIDGKLIGIRGRTSVPNYDLLGIPKYFPLRAYKVGGNIYGLYENYDNIVNKTKKVIIFEGEKSTLKLDSLNTPAPGHPLSVMENYLGEHLYGVSLCGHSLSDEQADILIRLNLNEYIIAFDKDISEKEIRNTCQKLAIFRNVSYIYDQFGILGPKDSPIDADAEEFAYLYKNRIQYSLEDKR